MQELSAALGDLSQASRSQAACMEAALACIRHRTSLTPAQVRLVACVTQSQVLSSEVPQVRIQVPGPPFIQACASAASWHQHQLVSSTRTTDPMMLCCCVPAMQTWLTAVPWQGSGAAGSNALPSAQQLRQASNGWGEGGAMQLLCEHIFSSAAGASLGCDAAGACCISLYGWGEPA